MTGATPEARLVLLVWIARFGTKIQTGKEAELDTLNLSKRHLKEALEYLTREGYLWKTKSLLPSAQNIKSRDVFDYGVTADCWAMWSESFITCNSWAMELLYVLTSTKRVNSKFNEKSNNISAEMRLVWAVMISRANPAGYVIEQDGQELIKILGMKEARLRRTVQALSKTGCISVAANGVASSVFFNRLEPIYKIHPQRPEQKIIKLAFPLLRDAITPFRFFMKLKAYGNRAKQNIFKKQKTIEQQLTLLKQQTLTKQQTLAKQKSLKQKIQECKESSSGFLELSKEHCYELSDIICSSRFSEAIHQLGMSIILSLLPNYTANRYPDGKITEISNELRKTLLDKLEVDIQSMLSEQLLDSPLLAFERHKTKKVTLKEIDIACLQNVVLREITTELCWKIDELSKGWRLYTERVGREIQPLDCLSGEDWVRVSQKNNGLAIKEQSEDVNGAQRTLNDSIIRVSCILNILVPNDEMYEDCMVMDKELWTANSRVKGVKSTIC